MKFLLYKSKKDGGACAPSAPPVPSPLGADHDVESSEDNISNDDEDIGMGDDMEDDTYWKKIKQWNKMPSYQAQEAYDNLWYTLH